jgi:hypothetical protein
MTLVRFLVPCHLEIQPPKGSLFEADTAVLYGRKLYDAPRFLLVSQTVFSTTQPLSTVQGKKQPLAEPHPSKPGLYTVVKVPLSLRTLAPARASKIPSSLTTSPKNCKRGSQKLLRLFLSYHCFLGTVRL